jgi:uncharacterized protein (TIGR03790 family)
MLTPRAAAGLAAVVWAGLLLQWSELSDAAAEMTPPASSAPASRFGATDLGVVVNTGDPLSVAIGNYYLRRRAIPESNIVRVRFDYRRDELPRAEFLALRTTVEKELPPHVQAYALTWARPYRVGCMSITSAFTFGLLEEDYCKPGCQATRHSPYFNTSVMRPYDKLGMRPTMSIAAEDLAHAQALIDRGVHSDGLAPGGTAYLVTTDDRQRNGRALEYPLAIRVAQHEFNFRVVAGPPPDDPADVMFYFTGAWQVAGIDADRFLPGAVADHLTSFGGMLTDSPQMSSLRWLDAGATGSYGTVVEPCNLLGKFPNVPVLLAHYLGGETLIEAYWKSVLMPGQGLFIGEPLAAPFRTPVSRTLAARP